MLSIQKLSLLILKSNFLHNQLVPQSVQFIWNINVFLLLKSENVDGIS